MWWRWALFILCGVLILCCMGSTAMDWKRGKTGPFGPRPENWWGCGAFTVVVGALMAWLGRHIF